MKEDDIKIVFTQKEMREEIERQRHHNPLVNRVLNSCAFAGMSWEEMYPVLAYYVLLESETLKKTVDDLLKNAEEQTLKYIQRADNEIEKTRRAVYVTVALETGGL